MTAGRLADLYRADPDAYPEELDALLGKTVDESGYRCVKDPVIRPRSLSLLDVGEAMLGRDGLRRLYENGPFGLRGGRARTVGEEVGGGALGPSEFQSLNAWLGTIDGLLGAELLDKYALATMLARELVTWKMGIRIQENKQIRYGFPTAPSPDLQPGQEFPAGDLTADWIRNNRMKKQGEVLSVAWEAMHFDQTDSLMDAVSGDNGMAIRFAVVIDERVQRALWGCENTYNRLGTIANTYLTTGGSYVNSFTSVATSVNDLVEATTCLDFAEQQLLAQTDPNTGLEIAPPDDERMLIVTPFKFLTASRLAQPFGEEIRTLSDPSRMQVPAPFYTGIKSFRMIRATRLMTAATTATPPGLGLTLAQAQNRWIWGSTKKAFQYRSAKDITTYRYSITDSPSLARRDVLMELDVSEMGSVTTVEPRYVILNGKDA
jgi:hypothetical protein